MEIKLNIIDRFRYGRDQGWQYVVFGVTDTYAQWIGGRK